MSTSLELLRRRERLRVGGRFLALRPKIAALGAAGNVGFLASSQAPAGQKLILAAAMSGTIAAFFAEAAWLERRELSERWLLTSLALTLLVLSSGAALSGGLQSPLLPLVFAPVVVGFAAFARTAQSTLLFGTAFASLSALAILAPLPGFPLVPEQATRPMLFISSLVSLALLAIGVTGLVDAHQRIAEELERMRSDMLKEAERRITSVEHLGAVVAHEVKNPLTAARGLVQLVERKATDPRDQKRLSVVVAEVDRALDVLQGYLSFARPLADLSPRQVDLSAMLRDVAGVLEARAEERGVRIQVIGDFILAWADRQRLRDAVLNLALNAINAMPEGGKLELLAALDENRARIVVSDQGVGMTSEFVARLGEPFASEAEGGTGLGVLVAGGVARQHGGELRFETARGVGTRAVLEFPAQVAESSG